LALAPGFGTLAVSTMALLRPRLPGAWRNRRDFSNQRVSHGPRLFVDAKLHGRLKLAIIQRVV
jgi:hypothetical protein